MELKRIKNPYGKDRRAVILKGHGATCHLSLGYLLEDEDKTKIKAELDKKDKSITKLKIDAGFGLELLIHGTLVTGSCESAYDSYAGLEVNVTEEEIQSLLKFLIE
jgi:hypothetical protein